MIQKFLIFKTKTVGFNRCYTRPEILNKKLRFFLLKRRFFLYKDYRTFKAPALKQREDNSRSDYFGKYDGPKLNINYLNEALLGRLKRRLTLNLGLIHTKYIHYRIKKKFKQINRDNRKVVFKQLGYGFRRQQLTRFIVQTKNVPRKAIFGSFRKVFFLKNNF